MTTVPDKDKARRSGESWMTTPDSSPLGRANRLQPTSHVIIKAAPIQRQAPYQVNKWPHGVVLGSIILDMIEYLRTDSKANATDQDLSLWLEDNYIRPFKSIERMEGLVVRDGLDMATLTYAHGRYTVIFPMPEGSGLPPQRLWVPGLEPMYAPQGDQHLIKFSEVTAPRGGFENFEMYKDITERAGVNLGPYKDPVTGWMRQLREAPPPSPQAKRVVQQDVGVKVRAPEKQLTPLREHNMDSANELMTSPKAMPIRIIGATGNQQVENKLTYSQRNMWASFRKGTEHDQSALSSAFANAGPDSVNMAGAAALVQLQQDNASTVHAYNGAPTLAAQNPTGTIQSHANDNSESENNEPWPSSTSDATPTSEAPTLNSAAHAGLDTAHDLQDLQGLEDLDDWQDLDDLQDLLPALLLSSKVSDASISHDNDDKTRDVETRSVKDDEDSEWSASMDLGEED